MINIFTPIAPQLKFSKNDPQDIRLGQWVQDTISPTNGIISEKSISIWGYPDDEGIQLNQGRPGAALAPDLIRTYLYRMTPPFDFQNKISLYDMGNLSVKNNGSLAERHEKARRWVSEITRENKKWISLGGGHDYGYSDSCGFVDGLHSSKDKPIIINFDAHLDVRPTHKTHHSLAEYNSGTPFFRLLEEYRDQIHFFEMGIQPQCNSRHHYEWAKSQGAKIYSLEDCHSRLISIFTSELKSLSSKNIFISLDMDAITSNEAPGCSQSWTTGFQTTEILDAIKFLTQNFHVQGLGIYETSPPIDTDNRTSKLAALIVYHYLFGAV